MDEDIGSPLILPTILIFYVLTGEQHFITKVTRIENSGGEQDENRLPCSHLDKLLTEARSLLPLPTVIMSKVGPPAHNSLLPS